MNIGQLSCVIKLPTHLRTWSIHQPSQNALQTSNNQAMTTRATPRCMMCHSHLNHQPKAVSLAVHLATRRTIAWYNGTSSTM